MEVSAIDSYLQDDAAELRRDCETALKKSKLIHANNGDHSLSLNHGYKIRRELAQSVFEIQFLVRKDKRYSVEMVDMAATGFTNEDEVKFLEAKKDEGVEYIF